MNKWNDKEEKTLSGFPRSFAPLYRQESVAHVWKYTPREW
jgi:hypothetical protein